VISNGEAISNYIETHNIFEEIHTSGASCTVDQQSKTSGDEDFLAK